MLPKSVPGGPPAKLGLPRALPDPTKNSLADLTFSCVFINIFPSEARFPSSFRHFHFSLFADSLQGGWAPFQ